MTNDLELALVAKIKERKETFKETLERFGFNDKDAINALRNFDAKETNLTSLEWLAMCGFGIDFTIKAMREKNYSRVLLGLDFITISLSKSNEVDHLKTFLTDFGKANALKRHAETYQLKSEVIKHWSENIDSALSNEKAAELLKKHFPLSHRKLSEYVSEAKRNKGK